jgi:hypothetical protein
MANTLTLTSLAENIFRARDIVARELVGFLPSIVINGGSEGVSLGGTVNSLVTAAPTVNSSITPAMTIPAADDQTLGVETMTIGQTANVRIPLNGEQFQKLAATVGTGVAFDQMFAQAFRAISNTIEAHVATVVKNGSSRATGTATTTPFGSNFDSIADVRQILVDNGCPINDGQLSLIIDTAAGAKLRKLSTLYKANEAGGSDMLRNGELLNLFGFSIKESAQVATHTKGSLGGSPTSGSAGFALGATDITLTAAGTGSIVAGDALSIANDTANVYIVKTGDTDVSDGGTIVLNGPGLRKATGASARALTIAASYVANVGFHRAAVELVMRPPANPPGGDAAVDAMNVFDPVSGLTFQVAQYKGYKMNSLDISVYYQAKVWKPNFVATLLG